MNTYRVGVIGCGRIASLMALSLAECDAMIKACEQAGTRMLISGG